MKHMKKKLTNNIAKNFVLRTTIILAHDEPPDWIIEAFFPYPSNLQQQHSFVSILDLTSSLLPVFSPSFSIFFYLTHLTYNLMIQYKLFLTLTPL